MKKLFLLLTLTMLTLFTFSQTIPQDSRLVKNGCSFTTKDAADVAAHHVSIMADESISDIIISKNSNGTYCSWTVVVCNPNLNVDIKKFDFEGADIKELEIIHVMPSPAPTAKISADNRTLSRCGFASQSSALRAVTSVIINDDETATSCVLQSGPNNSWCYYITITCNTPLEPAPRSIPALAPTTTCTKTLYGPNIWVGYPSCQEAENGAASWLQGKTSVILEAVEPYVWSSLEGVDNWGVKIKYTTSGSCYK
jgi:hypothetical protein